MKRLLLFVAFLLPVSFLLAQKTYDAQWRNVDALIQKKNLPKSALVIVKKIYAAAKAEGNEVQAMKALVYRIDLQEETRENNEQAAIAEVKSELLNSREPFASLLNSLLAGLYLRLFEEHRWQLYNRSKTENADTADITKWSIADFHQTIGRLYLLSIKQKELLQRTPLESYSTLLVKGNSSGLRPTLYDLLAHKALDYFESDERYVTKPEYNFTLSDPALFVQAKDFVGLNIKTADTSSLHYKALRIYQELLQFHLNDRIKDALIDADIRRISFVNRNATMDGHDTLYKAALENVLKEYSGNKVAYQAGYLLAMYYNNLADQYNPTGDTTHRYERIKAERLLERIVADSAEKSESWASCYNLLQEIRKPFLSVITEKVSLPAESFRALVKYKNAGQIIVQLIPSSQNLKDRLSGYNADYWKILKSQKTAKTMAANASGNG